jgi:hypothetical protein
MASALKFSSITVAISVTARALRPGSPTPEPINAAAADYSLEHHPLEAIHPI